MASVAITGSTEGSEVASLAMVGQADGSETASLALTRQKEGSSVDIATSRGVSMCGPNTQDGGCHHRKCGRQWKNLQDHWTWDRPPVSEVLRTLDLEPPDLEVLKPPFSGYTSQLGSQVT